MTSGHSLCNPKYLSLNVTICTKVRRGIVCVPVTLALKGAGRETGKSQELTRQTAFPKC